ncbi:MAG: hypothetical protein H0X31_18585 [Nostocaceae cyanobacterium]|nr:hypothetical protein [Nostocaceae cyanobacterium]
MSKTRKKPKSRPGKGLVAADKIQPQLWNISHTEAVKALKAQGYQVKEIKKISQLKYQISISYCDQQGNICSSFFSYRIFARWQTEVEKLIYRTPNLREFARLNHRLQYEFKHYPYSRDMEDTLQDALENREYQLNLAALAVMGYD